MLHLLVVWISVDTPVLPPHLVLELLSNELIIDFKYGK